MLSDSWINNKKFLKVDLTQQILHLNQRHKEIHKIKRLGLLAQLVKRGGPGTTRDTGSSPDSSQDFSLIFVPIDIFFVIFKQIDIFILSYRNGVILFFFFFWKQYLILVFC